MFSETLRQLLADVQSGAVSADAAVGGQPFKFKLAEALKQGPVVVYFYPKAYTGGCTAQGCSLRDSYDALTKKGLSFASVNAPAGTPVNVKIGGTEIQGFNAKAMDEALKAQGYPVAGADKSKVNYPMTLLILFIFLIYVTMVYGPIAAMLVELFPTRIRYSGMSLPYHIGNGWFGGFLPPTAFAIVAATGNIYSGLWYPIVVAGMTFVIGLLFVPETKDRDIFQHD